MSLHKTRFLESITKSDGNEKKVKKKLNDYYDPNDSSFSVNIYTKPLSIYTKLFWNIQELKRKFSKEKKTITSG